ncbi:biopolymer transporter ExbD [Halobacteriovorax sp. HLS]|uniref:biopolymer transporter ExbD n=1 Tax=Halobacteriovorax sp. HLS TaxID=2234000 RepID=UPI000FD7D107|nr:biopolymer transporter ExbD [Halobacteriovorax sp. HLS]
MRRARSNSQRGRGRKKAAVMDLDITSLLDILVILLVFLLKSYNSSGVVLTVPKGIELPTSESSSLNTSGIIVQVSPTTIWVDNKIVLESKKDSLSQDQTGRRIIPLYNELVKKKELIKQIEKSSPEAQKFTGVVNLVVDKTIKYSYIKKLMYTSATAGFGKYKFVVLSNE